MAYDLDTLRTKTQRRLDDDQFDTNKLTDFANDEQREIVNEIRLPNMERTVNFTLTIGDSNIGSLPTTFQTAINLRLTTEGYEKELHYVDWENIDEYLPQRASSQQTNSTPVYWWVFNGVIQVWPEPDRAYTATLAYIKSPAELINASDVPEVPEAFSEIMVLGMWERALEHEDSFTEAQVVRQKKEDLKAAMKVRLTMRQRGAPRIMRSNRGGRRWL